MYVIFHTRYAVLIPRQGHHGLTPCSNAGSVGWPGEWFFGLQARSMAV